MARRTRLRLIALGRRLEAVLDANPKSRRQIAAEAKTTTEQLSRIVHAKANPAFELLDAIAAAAGTTVAYLDGGSGPSPQDDAQIDQTVSWLLEKRSKITPEPNAQMLETPRRAERARRVPAGISIIAEGGAEIEIPFHYRSLNAKIVARSLDDSMIGAGILAGDVLFATEPKRRNVNGDIVIVRFDHATYVKRLAIDGERARLVSENPRYEVIEAATKEIQVIGVVIGRSGDIQGASSVS